MCSKHQGKTFNGSFVNRQYKHLNVQPEVKTFNHRFASDDQTIVSFLSTSSVFKTKLKKLTKMILVKTFNHRFASDDHCVFAKT